MLAGPMPNRSRPGEPLLVDDEHLEPQSTIMSTLDVAACRGGACLTARPEVKLAAMIEIARNLSRTLALDEVLPKLLDGLFQIFVQADRGFVVLAGPREGTLVPKAVKCRKAGDAEEMCLSRTILKQAMAGKEAILSADAVADARFDTAQSVTDLHIRSLMCAPLIDGDGRALGVIQVDTVDRRNRFNDDDLEVLASVASQAALAISNAELHEQALRRQAIERDLELAHRVQQGLLPAAPPRVPGYEFFSHYEAADQIGGDYYDYVPLPDGRVAVVVGDVSGKGVPAALLMAKLSGDVRFALATAPDPAAAARRINATFVQNGAEDRFVTLIVAVLDPKTHELTIVNAGHMPPLLGKADGAVEQLGAGRAGLPLGVADDFQYQSFTRALAPGECVTIFTDGISEAMDGDGQLYGLPRLLEQVGGPARGVAELGEQILADVRRFADGRPQSDDVCLVCFGRAG
jgi:serine phosphatase RsbU (regulator of sigma subunit)